MRNAEIALHFDELADLYELDGAIVHRVLAYRNAAKAIRESGASVAELTRAGTVTELPGIGKTIEEKINALLDTGLDPVGGEAEGQVPARPGRDHAPARASGPKRARKLFDELGIASLDELKKAAEAQQLRDAQGLRAEGRGEHPARRSPPARTGRPSRGSCCRRRSQIAEALRDALREHPAAERVEIAGSARRWPRPCKDIDLVATASDPRALAERVLRSCR